MERETDARDQSALERLCGRLAGPVRSYRLPFLAGLCAGLLAHGFAFANKLPNQDDVAATFSKGGSLDVGRWAIEGTQLLFPNVSMPWVYGLLTLLLFALSACVILHCFRLRRPLLQAAFSVCLLVFPALTATFCFMFTSVSYALSFLLAVLSVDLGCRERRSLRLLGCALLVLSLGVYQAYLAVAASLWVLLMIQKLLQGEKTGAVLRFGLLALARLLGALAVYGLISVLVMRLSGSGVLNYGVGGRSLPYRLALAYNALLKSFTRGYFGYVNSPLSKALHALLLLFLAAFFLSRLLGRGGVREKLLLLVCLLLLPLSMNCMFLAADAEIIHSLVLYSFVAVYVLALIAADCLTGENGRRSRDMLLVCLLLISMGNIYFANKCYLKLFFQYEQAQSFYTGLLTQIRQTEGYDADSRIALLGSPAEGIYTAPELDLGGLRGPNDDAHALVFYTKEDFIRLYLGADLRFADAYQQAALQKDPRVRAMPCYPYYGCIQKIDDFIVVRLGQ